MGQKRAREAEAAEKSKSTKMDVDDNSDDEDFDMVNVEFEWFNFDKDIDFHGVKNLFRQLLDADSTLFDLSTLTDLVVSENTIGSTVKVDSKENDAYAFLTVLNASTHAQNPAMAQLVNYLIEKAGTNPSLAPVGKILKTPDQAQLGLVISERMLNMPSEVAPPLYSLLLDEVEAAVEDNEPFKFTHWLILTRTYAEVESALDGESAHKKKKKRGQTELFYFHPEDEVFVKHAAAHGGYEYTKGEETSADSKRAFHEMGIKTQGHLILIEASKFDGAVKAVNEYIKPPV